VVTGRHGAIVFPPYRLDAEAGSLWRGTRRVSLTATDAALLVYLAARSGRLVTHEELLAAVWPGVNVAPGILKVRVRRLRRALGDRAARPRFIENVHGRGYRFIAPVTPVVSPRRVGVPPPDLPAADTPLFGREAELERLRALLGEAIHGRGHIAIVTGEAGIGKTRLVNDLATDALSLGCRVVIGHCHESDSILPFGPWVDAWRGAGVSADEKLLGTLPAAQRAELTRLFPEAGAADNPRPSDSALPLFQSVADLVEQVAAAQPLLLLLEDLHWADEMSLRLLAFVARRIPAWPAFLITTVRDEEVMEDSRIRRPMEEFGRMPSAVPVALAALSRRDTARLIAALARAGTDGAMVARVEEQIWAMSEGNPLVVVEAMRAVAEAGAAGPGDAPGALTVPARIRDLVGRRLDRLDARSRHIAAVAAVIGRRFDFALLHSASGIEEREAVEAVESMVRQRVFQPMGNQLDFAHDRIREVVGGGLLAPRRTLLHRAVARALEALEDGTGERIEQLAHHALRGEMWEEAVRYGWKAGDRAAHRSAYRQAVGYLEQALDALHRLPERPDTLAQAIDLRLDLRSALLAAREKGRIDKCLSEAEALAEALGDTRRLGQVLIIQAGESLLRGAYDQAITACRRALLPAAVGEDAGLRRLANYHLGLTHYFKGDLQPAIACFQQVTAPPEDTSRGERGMTFMPAVVARDFLAWSHGEMGVFADGRRYAEEALQIAEAAAHPLSRMLASWGFGWLCLRQGDLLGAFRHLECAMGICREAALPAFFPRVAAALSEAYALGGRLDGARQLLIETLAQKTVIEAEVAALQTRCYLSLGRVHLLTGDLREASNIAEQAFTSACSREERGHQAYALHLLGDIRARCDPLRVEQAEGHYRRALTLAESLGMRQLQAACHLGLGTLHTSIGRSRQGRTALTTAIDLYRAMEMDFWLLHSETVLARSESLEPRKY
jgi:DNA-binding winged helix-turn-helix (wHTH) protein/tetratricopeptide (TPR) repeat protein